MWRQIWGYKLHMRREKSAPIRLCGGRYGDTSSIYEQERVPQYKYFKYYRVILYDSSVKKAPEKGGCQATGLPGIYYEKVFYI